MNSWARTVSSVALFVNKAQNALLEGNWDQCHFCLSEAVKLGEGTGGFGVMWEASEHRRSGIEILRSLKLVFMEAVEIKAVPVSVCASVWMSLNLIHMMISFPGDAISVWITDWLLHNGVLLDMFGAQHLQEQLCRSGGVHEYSSVCFIIVDDMVTATMKAEGCPPALERLLRSPVVLEAYKLRLKLLPSPSKLEQDIGDDAVVADVTTVMSETTLLLPFGEMGKLLPLVLGRLWPLLKVLMRDRAWRSRSAPLEMISCILEALQHQPACSWYCRCSCAVEAAQMLLLLLGDAEAADCANGAQVSGVLRLACELACVDVDAETTRLAALRSPPIAEMEALWGLLLKCEEVVRGAAAAAGVKADDAAQLTSLVLGIAARFLVHIKANEPRWSGTRAQDALMRLLYSFVMSTLKAHLCKTDLFPRLEGMDVFWDFVAKGMEPMKLSGDLASAEETEGALLLVRMLGRATYGMLVCDWRHCVNMEGPSELKLVTKVCPRGRELKCSTRYCSPPCWAASWDSGHRTECPCSSPRFFSYKC